MVAEEPRGRTETAPRTEVTDQEDSNAPQVVTAQEDTVHPRVVQEVQEELVALVVPLKVEVTALLTVAEPQGPKRKCGGECVIKFERNPWINPPSRCLSTKPFISSP